MSECICGECRLPMSKHPVGHCPHVYEPVKVNGRIYGYMMRDKNKNEKKKNGLRGKAGR
jgi:hypothetical protein